jgi:hypothetical protein
MNNGNEVRTDNQRPAPREVDHRPPLTVRFRKYISEKEVKQLLKEKDAFLEQDRLKSNAKTKRR